MTFTTLGYAFLGGLLPACIWLYFLLKEDARCPEPKKMILYAFITGAAAVPLALPLELLAQKYFLDTLAYISSWAIIEEVLKYALAATFILWRHAVDEAPDYVVYMVTVALGFAAAENVLFLIAPLSGGHTILSFLTGDIRFLGANLLHVVASATVGFAFAFSKEFFPARRTLAVILGLILAIALHTAFNMLIITEGTSITFAAFFLVWTTAVIFFAAFEVLKYIQYRNLPTNTC